MRRGLGVVAIGFVLALAPMGGAWAAIGDACPDLSTGRVQPLPGTTAASVPAPEGMLIDQYCIVTKATVGASTIGLDPLTDMVSVETTDGSDIVEYSVSFVAMPPGEEESIAVTVPPAPATIGQEPGSSEIPQAAPAGDGSSTADAPVAAWMLLTVGALGLASTIAVSSLRPLMSSQSRCAPPSTRGRWPWE